MSLEAEGLRIRKWRHDHGLTQQQLADHLGVVWLTVQRWETGKREPPGFIWLALDRLDQLLTGHARERAAAAAEVMRARQVPPVLQDEDDNPF
jgi:transcriptional regulator with XRE-family HTH domain